MIEKTIQIGGRKVSYKEYGEAHNYTNNTIKPVFLLHGWGGSKESWDTLSAELFSTLGKNANDLRFISVDMPGFGQSEEPLSAWDVGSYTQWFEHFVAAIYKEYGFLGNYDLIIHSFGGRIVLKLFSEEFLHSLKEARPDRVVIIAGAGVKRPLSLRVRVAGLAARVSAATDTHA